MFLKKIRANRFDEIYSSSTIMYEIDDYEKIDNYLGAYYKTYSSYFDKYIEIDDLLGKIYEGTATQEEIDQIDLLNNQLGLLAITDDSFINYIDFKLGK